MAERLPSGTDIGGPLKTNVQVGTARRVIHDLAYRSNPLILFDDIEEFMATTGSTLTAPLTNNTANADLNNIPVADTSTVVAFLRVTRAGVVTAASVIAASTLATSNSNFVTFTMQNLGPAAGSNITMLATSPAGTNTTKVTGGTAITANVPYTLTLSSTTTTLPVNAGDVLKLTATVSGTLANVVDAPQASVTISSPGGALVQPFTFKTAGNPSVTQLASTAGGVAEIKLQATSEAQTAGLSFGDVLLLSKPDAGATSANGTVVPIFQCWFQIPTAITTAQKVLIGVGTAVSATATSITKGAFLQLDASMNVLLTARDGTNTNNSTTPSVGTFTLTAGQWYLATIDVSDPVAVRFWIGTAAAGDVLLGTLTMASLASTDLVQPIVYLQKSTGVTTPSLQVDMLRTIAWRPNMT